MQYRTAIRQEGLDKFDDPQGYPHFKENLDQFPPVNIVIRTRHVKGHDGDNPAEKPSGEDDVDKVLKRLDGTPSPKLRLGQEIVLFAEVS